MSTYLITQASGIQAQWTIKHLLAAGAKVHAVVRNPDKIPSVLESPGVTVFKGDSTNYDEIFEAAKGCKAVFLNTFPIPGLEAQQAKNIAEAAKAAGVESVVATTALLVGQKELWDDSITTECGLGDYFSSKSQVEDIVRAAGFKAYTILRPAFIHIDFMKPHVEMNFPGFTQTGVLAHAYNETSRMLYTDGSDIGKYAAAALQDPAKFGGQEIELGNEGLTIKEVHDILVRVSGKEIPLRSWTKEELDKVKAMTMGPRFQLWANAKDLSHTATAAKQVQAKFGIPFTSLESALEREKDSLLETLSALA